MANCIVSGRITKLTGAPVAGAVVGFRPNRHANAVAFIGDNAISDDEHVVEADDNGEFSVTLLQGADVVVRIEELNLYRQVTVPEQAQATLEELINADL